MQEKKTSSRVSKKSATQASKTSPRRVSKKTAKQPSASVSEKRSQTSSKKTSQGSEKELSVPTKGAKQGSVEKDNRPILVPLDFSAYSEAALEHAGLLADRMQLPIVVLHVVHDPGEAPGYYHRVAGRKKQLRRLEDVAHELLDEFMAKMAKRYREYGALRKAKRVLVTGLPVTRILEVAERLRPSMVVMGSAGRTGLSRFLLGSKTEQVLRMCPYPVTIVKVSEDQEWRREG